MCPDSDSDLVDCVELGLTVGSCARGLGLGTGVPGLGFVLGLSGQTTLLIGTISGAI